jgi:hypothetical protein
MVQVHWARGHEPDAAGAWAEQADEGAWVAAEQVQVASASVQPAVPLLSTKGVYHAIPLSVRNVANL